jgi:hypothetical protein
MKTAMLKKILMILLNVIIILWFCCLTLAMGDSFVNNVKYYLTMRVEEDLFFAIMDIIYIIAIWATYLSYWLKNNIIKVISLFMIVISLILVCLIAPMPESLRMIFFMYLPIIIVFVLGITRNKQKSEV